MSFAQAGERGRARRSLGVLSASLLVAACSPPDRKAEVERLVSQSVAPGYRAYDTEWGVIIAPDANVASTFADELRFAAASFYTSFGVRVPPGCVRVIQTTTAARCSTGAPWVMDWPGLEEEHRKDPGSSYWRLVDFGFLHDSSNNRAAFALGDRGACEEGYRPIAQASMLRHELLHQFFIRLLWPNNDGPKQYGGGAPDWLDEAAAISGEAPYLIRSRRARFMKMLEGGTVIPMDRFLRMEHPAMPSIRAKPRVAKKGQTTVIIEHQSPASGEGARQLDFYAQVRAFSDYLKVASGDQRVLRLVTRQLKEHGPPVKLGNTTWDKDDLQKQFLKWVQSQNWSLDDTVCV